MKLSGVAAIVTGASQGIGQEIARHFLLEGASVAICARSEADLARARDELDASRQEGRQLLAVCADVSNRDNTEQLVATVLETFGKLDILVNNAGIYGPKGNVEIVDLDRWIDTFRINVMGMLYMCRQAIPHLRQSRRGKIINMSGGGATSPMPGLSAYAATKTAVVRFTETLAQELADDGIDVNAVAPGALATRMLDEVLEEGRDKVPAAFYERMLKVKQEGGTPLEAGAGLCVYLASKDSDHVTGKLISAVWDDYKHLGDHLKELDSDIYTLRRIVPKDRGLDF